MMNIRRKYTLFRTNNQANLTLFLTNNQVNLTLFRTNNQANSTLFPTNNQANLTLFRTNATKSEARPLPSLQQRGERYAMHLYSSGGLRSPQQSTPSSLTYWERGRPRPRKN